MTAQPGMLPLRTLLLGAALLLQVVACGGSSSAGSGPGGAPPDASYLSAPGDARNWLTADQLTRSAFPERSPFHNGYFAPVGAAAMPAHAFSGSLQLQSRVIETSGPLSLNGERLDRLPAIQLRFVSHGEYLVPLDRDRQFDSGNGSYWGMILSPGRVWSEPGDGNWSRASFPFVLIHRQGNQTHNGLATFLYDGVSVSHLRLQVVQETAAWAKWDMWAHLPMTYLPQAFDDAAAVVASFDEELANQLPLASWQALEAAHGAPLPGFDEPAATADISASAVLWEGVLYLSRCSTRFGEYPYCRFMRHGAFSVTKSAGAAVALLRLAQKYGPGVLDEQIADHVAVTVAHGGWTGVTFRHALDMTVGIGDRSPYFDSNDTFADENQPKMDGILSRESTAGKLETAFAYNDYPWGPGVKMRYNSTHTFVLVAAMDAYLKAREGPGASIDRMLQDEVYRPIGIQHFPLTMTIEPDGSRGLPLLLIGSYPTLDEIARIAQLFQREGRHEGVELLHPELTASALYRRDAAGLPAHFWANSIEPTRYQSSFWAWASLEAGGCLARTPVMSGFGGSIVALLPNGASAIRFADGDFYSAQPLVETARRLGPLCE